MAFPSKHIRLSFLWRKATATLTLKFEDRKAISSKVLDTNGEINWMLPLIETDSFKPWKIGFL